MDLPYFIFNNVNSNDMGIVVKEMPPIIKSQKDIDIINISGRNGDSHIDNGTYKSKTYKITCVLMDISKIDNLKVLYDGIGTLELSSELGREYKAVIKNQIDFSRYLTFLKDFTLEFSLHPIAYSKQSKVLEFLEDSIFDIGGTIEIPPLITVNGTGTVTINNVSFEVLETGITIDCDLMNCSINNLNKNDKVVLDEFPKLIVGENTIVLGSGITSVIIQYKEGWL